MVQIVRQEKGINGQGRGLSSGSFVLHLLGVTLLNPMEHGLLFEHFFPVDRVSSIAIGLEMDIDSVENKIWPHLVEHEPRFDNLQIVPSHFCHIYDLHIDGNIVQLTGNELLTRLSERSPTVDYIVV